MKKKLVYIFICILVGSIFSCEKSRSLSEINTEEEDIYAIINHIINQPPEVKDYACKYVVDRYQYAIPFSADSIQLMSAKATFSKADLDYIFKQAEKRKQFKLNQNLVKNKKLISADTLQKIAEIRITTHQSYWDVYEIKYGKSGYFAISVPLFSIDRKKAVVRVEENLFGLSGGGYLCVYRKINGKWKQTEVLSAWMA